MQIREQDIDIENRYILIHHPKTGDTKPVPMLDEDIQIFKQIKPGFPRSYFSGMKLGKAALKKAKDTVRNSFINGGKKPV